MAYALLQTTLVHLVLTKRCKQINALHEMVYELELSTVYFGT